MYKYNLGLKKLLVTLDGSGGGIGGGSGGSGGGGSGCGGCDCCLLQWIYYFIVVDILIYCDVYIILLC